MVPHSQVEEFVVQRLVGVPFDRLSDEVGHFVGILTASGDSYTSGPVVVQVAKLIAQPLQNVRRMVRLVVHHNVVGWRNATLTDRLRYQEVIEMVATGNGVVQNGARVRIFQVVSIDAEHSGIDTLLDDNKRDLRNVVGFH